MPNLIDQAIEYLKTRGWIQGELYKDNVVGGPACMNGALFHCTGYHDKFAENSLWRSDWVLSEEYKAFVRTHDVINLVLWEQYETSHFFSWQDAPERTFEEVISILEKASVRLNELV